MQTACIRLVACLVFQSAALAVPSVELLTPSDGNSIAGNAVAVAAVATEFDPTLVRLQFRFFDSSDPFADIGQDTLPLYVVPWDTTPLDNGTYELRAVATPPTGTDLVSPSVVVTIINTPNAAPDVSENLSSNGVLHRSQQIQTAVASEVIMSDGARFPFAAGALPSDRRLEFERRPAAMAPGVVPGQAVGPITVALTSVNLLAPLEIVMPYSDDNQDGIEDSTQSPETRLTTWYFDSQIGWRPIASNLDAMANVIDLSTSVPLPKQFEVFKVDQPLIERGSRNPTDVSLGGTATAVPVLQARIATGPDTVAVEAVTVSLDVITGTPPAGMVTTVTIVRDENNNGEFDANEDVLAETSGPLDTAVADLPLSLTDPLTVQPISETQLLVLLSLQPEHSSLAAPASRQSPPLSIFGIPILFCTAACTALFPQFLRRRRTIMPILMIAFCLIFAPACFLFDGDASVDEPQTPAAPQQPEQPEQPPTSSTPAPFVFDVVVRTHGISGQNINTTQPFSGPTDREIRGASVELTPP